MEIRANTATNRLEIILTLAEARLIEVDHGELEMCLPADDSLGIMLDLGDAMRLLRAEGED
jgi:hypothetical protein